MWSPKSTRGTIRKPFLWPLQRRMFVCSFISSYDPFPTYHYSLYLSCISFIIPFCWFFAVYLPAIVFISTFFRHLSVILHPLILLLESNPGPLSLTILPHDHPHHLSIKTVPFNWCFLFTISFYLFLLSFSLCATLSVCFQHKVSTFYDPFVRPFETLLVGCSFIASNNHHIFCLLRQTISSHILSQRNP